MCLRRVIPASIFYHPQASDNSHDHSGPPTSRIPNAIPEKTTNRAKTTQARLEILEQAFAHDKKPSSIMHAILASQLDMTTGGIQASPRILTSQIFPHDSDVFIAVNLQLWFQNRYARNSHLLTFLGNFLPRFSHPFMQEGKREVGGQKG